MTSPDNIAETERQAKTLLEYLRHHEAHRTPFIPGPQDVAAVEGLYALLAEAREALKGAKDAAESFRDCSGDVVASEVIARIDTALSREAQPHASAPAGEPEQAARPLSGEGE